MTGPPIYLVDDFLKNASELFDYLLRSIVWDERMKARQTASFGLSYDYSQISYAEVALPPELDAICEDINVKLGFKPNNCLANFYTDGSSSMGFHSDSSKALAGGTGVAIVSLGSVRSIVYRPRTGDKSEFDYPLKNGSLLYMSQEMQSDWLHAIPKAENCGARISLTFRQIVK